MHYSPADIDQLAKKIWSENKVYKTENDFSKPKHYVLEMFPYPSGAGLHVGHPLGYVASDIYARFKRMQGFNVLHPMGFDSFGLPAEQYAIETGKDPRDTTKVNIETYKKQFDKIGLSFDWSREVVTSSPEYYRWTQWLFIEMFNSIYCYENKCAYDVKVLIKHFEEHGNHNNTAFTNKDVSQFSAEEWKSYSEKEKSDVLMNYRLIYIGYGEVNWCEALGTVLANDEVINGRSERGNFPVVKKKMKQWNLRMTAYADRLLEGLEKVSFSNSLKDQQRNWIGKSTGASMRFAIANQDIGININEIKKGINKLVIETLENNVKYSKLKFGKLSEEGIEILNSKFDLNVNSNTFFSIDNYSVIHTIKNHGDKKEMDRGQLPIEKTDFESIIDILLNPTNISLVDKTQRNGEGILIEGSLNGEDFYIIKTIRRGKNELALLTMYKRNSKSDKIINSPIQTSEASSAILSTKIQTFENIEEKNIEVYTTRPDTIFGATFIVLAPENSLVGEITTEEYKIKVNDYIAYCKSKSDIDRQAEKEVSGQFTGAYVTHPFTGKDLPIYIAEYVLMGYGTGAIMAVPAEDERDRKFAEKFGIEIVEIFDKTGIANAEIGDKQGKLINSEFINGLTWKEGFDKVLNELESREIGERKTQFRLRDANYSRQRYWGEPIPILWKDDVPYPLEASQLPLLNPDVDSFLPSKEGLAPNARNEKWVNEIEGYTREVDTMPAFAGSSWYFLRYMDSQNDKEFVGKDLAKYWGQVDLYQGGSEHAVGHLLYARYFNLFLYDRGYIKHEEPFKRLINQGMIQGRTQFVYRLNSDENKFISKGLIEKYKNDITPIRVDVNIVENDVLDLEAFKNWRVEFANAEFELEDENYICGWEIEKMSKSKYNVVNPDDVIIKYGADCFRMYEMFLGPIEQSKPWNTTGIEGVSKFLKRFWNLYFDEKGVTKLTESEPSVEELKILHRTIDKLGKDIENFSFNTCVSALMIALNEFNSMKTNSSKILVPLLKAICPLAPHTAETIWSQLGNKTSIVIETYPEVDGQYLLDDSFNYPVSINGKMRVLLTLSADVEEAFAREKALENETVQKWIEGKEIKKFIFVKSRMINIVV
jgi:leucyl-tRNA synthetase